MWVRNVEASKTLPTTLKLFYYICGFSTWHCPACRVLLYFFFALQIIQKKPYELFSIIQNILWELQPGHDTLLYKISTCPLLSCLVISPCCSVAGRWHVLLRTLHKWLYLCLLRPYRRQAHGQMPLSLWHIHTHLSYCDSGVFVWPAEIVYEKCQCCRQGIRSGKKILRNFGNKCL